MGDLVKLVPRTTKGEEENVRVIEVRGEDISQRLKEEVETWTKELHWRFCDFEDFLKLIEVKTSIIPDSRALAEVCYEAGKLVEINFAREEVFIEFWSYNDGRMIVEVSEQTERREYEVVCCKEPSVKLKEKTIDGSMKNLYCRYDEETFEKTVFLPNQKNLKIEIKGLDKARANNDEYIENYLLNLNGNSLNVVEIYETLLQLFCLSNDDISRCEEISIIHFEDFPVGNEDVISKLLIQNGQWMEYIVTEGQEKFSLDVNGDRKYSFDTRMSIGYMVEKSDCKLDASMKLDSCKDFAEMAKKLNSRMQYVEEKFKELETIMASIIV